MICTWLVFQFCQNEHSNLLNQRVTQVCRWKYWCKGCWWVCAWVGYVSVFVVSCVSKVEASQQPAEEASPLGAEEADEEVNYCGSEDDARSNVVQVVESFLIGHHIKVPAGYNTHTHTHARRQIHKHTISNISNTTTTLTFTPYIQTKSNTNTSNIACSSVMLPSSLCQEYMILTASYWTIKCKHCMGSDEILHLAVQIHVKTHLCELMIQHELQKRSVSI